MRRDIAAGVCRDRRPRAALDSLILLLTARWERGLAGWLTAAEGDRLADELTADAAERKILAGARAEDLDDGRFYLIFWGGRYGDQRLALSVTSPIAARRQWESYLSSCARLRMWLVGGLR